MPLWLAVVLLIAALTGIALACKYLQKSRPARVLCISSAACCWRWPAPFTSV